MRPLVIVAAALLPGCWQGQAQPDMPLEDTSADGDGDADVDADVDGDADADTECSSIEFIRREVSAKPLDGFHLVDVFGLGGTDFLAWPEWNSDGFDVCVLRNQEGDGSVWTETTVVVGMGQSRFPIGDVDGDGDIDAIGMRESDAPEQPSIWENTGPGQIWEPALLSGEEEHLYAAVDTGDLDGDGDLDLLSSGYVLGQEDAFVEVSWLENLGGGAAWERHTVFTGGSVSQSSEGWTGMVFDLDGDGDNDVLVMGATMTCKAVRWYENVTGDGLNMDFHHVFDGVASVRYVPGDVTGDGAADLVYGGVSFGPALGIAVNPGDSGGEWSVTKYSDMLVRSLDLADLDRDGDLDLLLALDPNASMAQLSTLEWWENVSGDGIDWEPHAIIEEWPLVHHVVAGDVDGDGDMDFATREQGDLGSGIFWYEPTCAP